jgi:hypothetical protein
MPLPLQVVILSLVLPHLRRVPYTGDPMVGRELEAEAEVRSIGRSEKNTGSSVSSIPAGP